MNRAHTAALLARFGQVRRKLNRIATQRLKPHGIGVKQALLLRQLHQSGGLSAADLSRVTSTDPASTCRCLGAMIRGGWVMQANHPGDRRRSHLTLTPSGRRLAARATTLFVEVDALMRAPLSRPEQQTLLDILGKIDDSLSLPGTPSFIREFS